jgi:hypothetical protein
MSENELPSSGIILYQTENGRTRIECRFENRTIWLTQALIADLFQIGENTVNYHIVDVDVANVPFATAKHGCSSRVLLDFWP